MNIRLRQIERSFGSGPVLHGVNLDVESGELVALLGPSGSGKTTLLRIIAGLDVPDAGDIYFGQDHASSKPVQERQVGFVFQNYALFAHLTVFDNIAFGLEVRDRKHRPSKGEIHRRVMELLELVQLSGLEKRFPAQLSGGQRQRVALARALAMEPRVLLLDEPFGALDTKVRKELRGWVRDIHRRTGHTTLFVTHDQDEAIELADRIVILNEGRIIQEGTPDHLYDVPANPFIAHFMGDCNQLPVKVRAHQCWYADTLISHAVDMPEGPATLLFRPHDVDMSPADAGLAGVVQSVRTMGPVCRLDVALKPHGDCVAVDLPRQRAVAIGTHLHLRIGQSRLFAA